MSLKCTSEIHMCTTSVLYFVYIYIYIYIYIYTHTHTHTHIACKLNITFVVELPLKRRFYLKNIPKLYTFKK